MSLSSPTLPVGGFTYSQGIEWAVEAGWITDETSASAWIESQLVLGLGSTDLPVAFRLYQGFVDDDVQAVAYWSDFLLACRETRELREEERNRARAMVKILESLEISPVEKWQKVMGTNYAGLFMLAAYHWHIPVLEAMLGYAWSWLDNQVACVVKIVPLGQTQGQKMLHHLSEKLTEVTEKSCELADDELGISQPALAIASSSHETQYTRIFRS